MSVSFPVSFIILKRIVRRIYIELIVKVSGENSKTSLPGGAQVQLRNSNRRGQTKFGQLWIGGRGDPELLFFFRTSSMNDPFWKMALREKCQNMEFVLVHTFPHWYWIRRDTPYLSVFSPNAGKYGLEKAPYLDTFHAVLVQVITWNDAI